MPIKLGEIFANKTTALNPSKFPNEIFDLLSIPAYDLGEPSPVKGSAIGSQKTLVLPGDVLISKIVPHIRRVWIVPPSLGRRQIASSEWIVFRGNNLDPNYLRHVLLGDPFHEEFMATVAGVGGSLVRARPIHVAKIEIPFPDISEQERIAKILDQAEAMREIRQRSIALLDELSFSIFDEIFSNPDLPHSLPGHRNWPNIKIKELGKITTGRTPPGSRVGMFGGEIPFVTPGDLNSGESVKRYLTFEGAETVKIVKKGSLLVCCIGTIGKMAIAQEESSFNQQINAIEWFDLITPRYGFFALQKIKPLLIGKSTSTTVPILNKSQFQEFQIPVPPLSIQTEFESKLLQIEDEMLKFKSQLALTNELFSSLQSLAFAGEL